EGEPADRLAIDLGDTGHGALGVALYQGSEHGQAFLSGENIHGGLAFPRTRAHAPRCECLDGPPSGVLAPRRSKRRGAFFVRPPKVTPRAAIFSENRREVGHELSEARRAVRRASRVGRCLASWPAGSLSSCPRPSRRNPISRSLTMPRISIGCTV